MCGYDLNEYNIKINNNIYPSKITGINMVS